MLYKHLHLSTLAALAALRLFVIHLAAVVHRPCGGLMSRHSGCLHLPLTDRVGSSIGQFNKRKGEHSNSLII